MLPVWRLLWLGYARGWEVAVTSLQAHEVPLKQPRPVYVIRAGQASDKPFVAQCWAREFRASEGWVRQIDSDFITRCIYPRIEEILNRADVRVAGPPEDETTVYGFSVVEPGLVHLVYVRRAWRRMGIATALLAGIALSKYKWTTQTREWLEWARHKYELESYQPFWMTPGKGDEWKPR